MQGKRHDLEHIDDIAFLEQGEYGKAPDGIWWMRPPVPGFGIGNLKAHDIKEHEDGTITVSPSILITGHHGKQWHGYLERGVWRQA